MIPVQESKTAQIPWQLNSMESMNDVDYASWLTLLEQRTGITLPEERKTFLLSKLSIRMREIGITDYQSYYNLVTSGRAGNVEWETLVDRLTVHETRFFRDTQALELIKNQYLEKLINAAEQPVNINVWSVGCATGEEPYSLMMYIDKYLSDNNVFFYLSVTASDISNDAIAVGKRGVYHKGRFKNVPDEYINAYVNQFDSNHYEVIEPIRKRVCFNRVNLLNLATSKVGLMDIMVCQNVLIYFKRERRLKILNELANYLKPGGLLILGAGEILDWKHPQMSSLQKSGVLAFQRKLSVQESVK